MSAADDIIAALGLGPHPEGGWYRELWRAEAPPGERAGATSIHFLLEAGQRSHWHKVDATEIWLWHAGDPLLLSLAPGDAGPVGTVRLGPDILAGDVPQQIIAPGEWQAAGPVEGAANGADGVGSAGAGYSLVSCIVAPGFEFAGFTLAPPGWAPGTG